MTSSTACEAVNIVPTACSSTVKPICLGKLSRVIFRVSLWLSDCICWTFTVCIKSNTLVTFWRTGERFLHDMLAVHEILIRAENVECQGKVFESMLLFYMLLVHATFHFQPR